ncbi:phosphate propanoyltransferase [Thermohalobacter berrensis]|uniref:Phosphate propanoyltransferase n=1 Tax=Thermohalobacter berrensis TaxID=99594 RepID=A0A419T5B8_9FIRM|nr:phosphate propanoyltransferase [Thermohalobacter berrensis]RKD32757.1 propanediol utilization protein [Thermohalobacter berrensis]
MSYCDEKIVNEVTKKVLKKIKKYESNNYIPIGVSNRHIHLCRKDLNLLFGLGYRLTKLKDLNQPGQFAAKETVTIIGPKGIIENVRILGPLRNNTQVEISLNDGFKLGVKPPVRESGNLENTPGIFVKGPKGVVELKRGVIAALRHIHMPKDYAAKFGFKDKQMVSVINNNIRKVTFHNVLIRVSDKYNLEMHIDIDEANCCGLSNGDKVKILKN